MGLLSSNISFRDHTIKTEITALIIWQKCLCVVKSIENSIERRVMSFSTTRRIHYWEFLATGPFILATVSVI